MTDIGYCRAAFATEKEILNSPFIIIYSPYYATYTADQLNYFIYTSATSGNISTQNFGEKYVAEKVDGNIYIWIKFYVPTSLKGNNSTKFMINIMKRTMKDISHKDQMKFGDSLILLLSC